MQCVIENDLEINQIQIPFAQMFFLTSHFHVEVTDNPCETKDIGCVSHDFTVWWRGIGHVPNASQFDHVVPKRNKKEMNKC